MVDISWYINLSYWNIHGIHIDILLRRPDGISTIRSHQTWLQCFRCWCFSTSFRPSGSELFYDIYIYIYNPHLVMQIIFLGVQYPKIILKSPIWSNLHILTLRPFEPRKAILVQNMSKIFQDYFANVRPQESNVHGGEFTGTYMYVKPQEKNAPWLFEGVWFFTWL